MPVPPFGLPLAVWIAILAAVGALGAAFANRAIYELSHFKPRPLSPWAFATPEGVAPRGWLDRLPVVGWWRLRRESAVHGARFWIRPAAIEWAAIVLLPLLWWAEASGWLLPFKAVFPAGVDRAAVLNWQFLSHALLIGLMTVATFIDFDEQMIPDEITVPGTLLGLILATSLPWSTTLLPARAPVLVQPMRFVGEGSWSDDWDFPNGSGLALALVLYCGWCFALIPALCTARKGLVKGIRFYFASLFRGDAWKRLFGLAFVGSIAIALVWRFGGDERWASLLTALVGVAGGGAIVWVVRIAGQLALGKEAMGFGDVTLLAMIGAFLGWQGCAIVFFAAPLAALLFAVGGALTTGRRDIPYGPYLCAATLAVILLWPAVWARFRDIFALGGLLIAALAVIFVATMGLLALWRLTERALFGTRDD